MPLYSEPENIDGNPALYALERNAKHITYRGDKCSKNPSHPEAVDTIALSPVYLSFSCDLIVSYDFDWFSRLFLC